MAPSWPWNSAKLPLERRFGRPNGVKLALERRFGRPGSAKLALERRFRRPWIDEKRRQRQKDLLGIFKDLRPCTEIYG